MERRRPGDRPRGTPGRRSRHDIVTLKILEYDAAQPATARRTTTRVEPKETGVALDGLDEVVAALGRVAP